MWKQNKTKFDVPIFLFGHSLGGLLSLFTYNKKPELFKGMALLSP
jgi:predicted alpha/beta superfamily hydrolase